jgi:hypothetical protein
MSVERARITFGPEALSRFNQILEEVSLNLVDDGLTAELVRSDEMRRKLAQRLLGFARHWWTDTQIKQLLLRALRNQISASRRHQTAAGVETRAENLEQDRDGWWAIWCAYFGLDESQAFWRRSILARGSKCGQGLMNGMWDGN